MAQGHDAVDVALEWIEGQLAAGAGAMIGEIEALYRQVQTRVEAAADPAVKCLECGKCCNFEAYGHRLYATTLEMLYFFWGAGGVGVGRGGVTDNGTCPYLDGRECGNRAYRTAGCRIFFCRGVPEAFQHELTEQVLDRLRRLHGKLGAVYCYADLREWLGRWRGQ